MMNPKIIHKTEDTIWVLNRFTVDHEFSSKVDNLRFSLQELLFDAAGGATSPPVSSHYKCCTYCEPWKKAS